MEAKNDQSEENVNFYFYGNLVDFLKKNKTGQIVYPLTYKVSVKDAIESLGIPHVEINRISIKERSIPFTYILQPMDCINVYPFEKSSISFNETILRQPLSLPYRFLLDVHLGSLARLLRLTGFDALYERKASDAYLAREAAKENRILLSRDIGLLKHKIIDWGYWLRSQQPEMQFYEVAERFNLWTAIRPFTFCLSCNGKIDFVSKQEVGKLIPTNASTYYETFYQCLSCKRIYWEGSHYDNMIKTIERLQNLKINS